jgi:hypothetical protein
VALPGLIAIHIQEQKDFLRDSHHFPNRAAIQVRRKQTSIESVWQNIDGSRDTLSLQHLSPFLRKDKEAVGVAL